MEEAHVWGRFVFGKIVEPFVEHDVRSVFDVLTGNVKVVGTFGGILVTKEYANVGIEFGFVGVEMARFDCIDATTKDTQKREVRLAFAVCAYSNRGSGTSAMGNLVLEEYEVAESEGPEFGW